MRLLALNGMARTDSEHEQALIRVLIGILVLSYIGAGQLGGVLDASSAGRLWAIAGSGELAAGALFAGVLLRPGASHARRLLGMLIDNGSLGLFLHYGQSYTAPWVFIFLWVTLGNGFRYGQLHLAVSAGLNIAAFGTVWLTTEYWRSLPFLSGGTVAALIVLPLYASSLIRKLELAREQAEAASRAKSQFLAIVSHELRTPLAVITAASSLLRQAADPEEARSANDSIIAAAKSLLTLLDDVLDLSKMEAGGVELRSGAYDLHKLLAEIRRIAAPLAAGKGLALRISVAHDVPSAVRGDMGRLRQVLVNLLTNAVKFTSSGSVMLAVAVAYRSPGFAQLSFTVADTGIGIAPDDHRRIFERFTQVDQSQARRYGGVGLGLAIANEIVRAMGSALELDSALGRGSEFRFKLGLPLAAAGEVPDEAGAAPSELVLSSGDPALEEKLERVALSLGLSFTALRPGERLPRRAGRGRAAAILVIDEPPGRLPSRAAALAGVAPAAAIRIAREPQGATPAQGIELVEVPCDADEALFANAVHLVRAFETHAEVRPADLGAPSARRCRILLAEDNPSSRRILKRILEKAGHKVTSVADGEQALDALEDREFDLSILDMNMPGVTGADVLKMYRSMNTGSRLPFLALTADATSDAREACERAGFDDFRTKPIDPQALLDCVDRMARQSGPGLPPRPAEHDVVALSEHPRFAAQRDAVLDQSVLSSLRGLGSDDRFFHELVHEFLDSGARCLGEIDEALSEGNLTRFRDRTHALRSGVANLGAKRLYRMLLDARSMDGGTLRAEGKAYGERLHAEFEAVRELLLSDLGARPGRSPTSGPSR